MVEKAPDDSVKTEARHRVLLLGYLKFFK